MSNKKGFTLVELLAVIVILALIMSIAIISIGGILNSSRQSTFKETAVNIINGVRQQLTLANRLEVGDFEFSANLLEKGGTDSPLGGTIQYRTDFSDCATDNQIGDYICKLNYHKTCSGSTTSFVRVTSSNDVYTYSICLTAGAEEEYIGLSSEAELLDNNNSEVIKDSSSAPTYYSPDAPTIKGGATKVYGYAATTLTCTNSTSYDSGTTVKYEFGYASSVANYNAGTITWLGSPSTSATISIAKNAYRGNRYYGCRIYLVNGSNQSDPVQSTATTTMSLVNARVYFDATTNGGTISGTTPRYVPYGATNVYTGRTNTTSGAIPTATKSGATFTGWWTAASGGSKVVDASGNVQASVSGWTNASKQWLRTATGNNDTSNRLYAQFS